MDINFFEVVGFVTIMGVLSGLIMLFAEWFNDWFVEWRKYECKIKCLCKHKYKLEWLNGNGVANLKCSNCGKKKQMTIDIESFEVFLG